ncbi:hypothetical protein MRB53_023033 [Persea americana]|uniref:Uncharacterized protein n=1 Tax=Persea americana TaxID=3435 RepID=A0ACC2L8M2_PERAE|nr:hypothetical protein MRB53_023033 [Persea americana]|eukprot:TRINITY_DN7737_c0_g1_i3.p1 TRINITY_DN7737_c0_g1~~TRINITY_DN7737_c0_g1_i3.p1  ORF type:complete len:114 (+),score=33.23 TRINITY_DN7737_c0_g1_i3:207-548(+)
MKQKLVVKLNMHDAKGRSKAMKIAVGLPGVISATIEGADKDQIAVVGDGVDSIDLTKLLRKRMGSTELVSVTPMDEKKKEEEKKPEATIAWPYQYYPIVPQQHFVYETPYSFM